ncbi:MAG: hypothetical protein CNE93_07110 [SAR116 cluster bacterium MED-G06]|nr:MAG: hypothetical protein CNE93_07110 [SAR116 cluster bacterium MED-G06]|tara:strand:- start:302 stop:763 length:462 start_codon:yes stop_codon:yes gene_type:complete
MLPSPALRHVADFDIDLSPIEEMGDGRGGMRRIIPIVGGRVSGPAFTGEILNIGADWQTIFSSGLAELDTRYAFRTDDDAVIEIINFGYRRGPEDVMKRIAAGETVDPSDYYMRTHARLETGHPDYQWVNETLFLGVGGRLKSSVRLALYAID